MTQPPDQRSPIAAGAAWASRIISVSVEMVAPALLGYWLDGLLGTKVLLTVLGVALGMTVGIWQLIRMTASGGNQNKSPPEPPTGTPTE